METVREFRNTFKVSGFRGVIKRYGWKLFAVLFVYYLIRDICLYLLLPYLVVKGFVFGAP